MNLHHLRTWPLPPRLTTHQSLAAGAGILAAAVLIRLWLDHVVPGRLAFVTYFPAAALAAFLTGAPGGLVVLAGGVMGALYSWCAASCGWVVAFVGNSMFAITGGVLVLALSVVREALFELEQRDERARITNRELAHRNRNQYAVITAMVTQTMRRAGIGSKVTDALADRIVALAQAQDLVSLDPQQDTCFERLIERVLVPMVPGPSRIAASGSRIGIPADLVSDLALVLHELGTNALKYGAWSGNNGQVAVSWQQTDEGVSIMWRERGGPPPASAGSQVSGLGSELMENGIPGAIIERQFEPAGLTVALNVPLGGRRRPSAS